MINNYLDPLRILSYNDAKIITKKEYTILKRKAKIEKDKIKEEFNLKDENPDMIEKLIKIAINNKDYDDISILNKEIILANALLPDDIKIIDTLTENGFTLEHIKTIIRFRGILKNLVLHKSIITEELKEQITIYKRVITKLIYIFNENFHINNSTIILNKLCEILVNYPELLESKNKSKKLTK